MLKIIVANRLCNITVRHSDHIVVVQWQQKIVQKNVMHVHVLTFCLFQPQGFYVLVAICVIES